MHVSFQMTSYFVACILLAVCLVDSVYSWGCSTPRNKYCGYDLDKKVVEICHPKWFAEDCAQGNCPLVNMRKKRSTEDGLLEFGKSCLI